MAESGGNPNAISRTNDYGLWQINASHGALATLNPLGSAEAAVSISGNGSNWGAWTTYTSGAYSDRC
jgi:soluble lytic murein transglycosylase-like protein